MHGRSLYDHFRRSTFPSLSSGGEGIVPGRYCGSTSYLCSEEAGSPDVPA
jgi:hypothetical protein